MDMEQLRLMADSLQKKYRKHQDDNDYGNLKGLEHVLKNRQPNMDEIDQLERGVQTSSAPVQGFAQGGVVDHMELPESTIQFDPKMGLPPPPTITPEAPGLPLQAPNPINQYLDTQKANLNKFGPEQQLELSNKLIQQRKSLPAVGARALGGFADALSRVGGSQSNYQGQITDNQNQMAGEQTSALERAGTQNLARSESQMKLDQMDPRSALSQTLQKAWGSLLSQNGFTPEQVAQMPASAIAALTGQSVEQAKAKAEAQLAAASLGLNTLKAGEEARHNVQGENIAKAGQIQTAEEKEAQRKKDALSALSKRGPLDRLSDTIFSNPATEQLKQDAGLQAPSIQSSANGGWTYLGPKK